MKEGRSGPLCFVTVRHEISNDRGLALRERHDIVYRDIGGGQAKPPSDASPKTANWRRSVEANAVLLFRYSALTFNGHRIHYDRDYCIKEERYPGLVFHGPLQATLLLQFGAEITAPPGRLRVSSGFAHVRRRSNRTERLRGGRRPRSLDHGPNGGCGDGRKGQPVITHVAGAGASKRLSPAMGNDR